MKKILLMTFCIASMMKVTVAQPNDTIDPDLLNKARSNDYVIKGRALKSLIAIVQQGKSDNLMPEILQAGLTVYSPPQGGADIAGIAGLQCRLVDAFSKNRLDNSDKFLQSMLKAANQDLLPSVRGAIFSAMAAIPNEKFLHSLLEAAVDDVKVNKKDGIGLKVIRRIGWGAIPAILSYFSDEREPLAAKVVVQILKDITGEATADAILASKIEALPNAESRKGLQQLRDALKDKTDAPK